MEGVFLIKIVALMEQSESRFSRTVRMAARRERNLDYALLHQGYLSLT